MMKHNKTTFLDFETGDSASDALAEEIAALLDQAIVQKGQASLVASGGSTPKALYQKLSSIDLNWSQVFIVLADERWVDPGMPGSNETFLRENLLCNQAQSANLIGLKTDHDTPFEAVEAVQDRLSGLAMPFDCAVLGMGSDGHTLSWFPDCEGLDQALNHTGAHVAAINAIRSQVTGPYTQRMTLSRSALNGMQLCALLLSGEEKRACWQTACEDGAVHTMPIRALIHDPDFDLKTYWWP